MKEYETSLYPRSVWIVRLSLGQAITGALVQHQPERLVRPCKPFSRSRQVTMPTT